MTPNKQYGAMGIWLFLAAPAIAAAVVLVVAGAAAARDMRAALAELNAGNTCTEECEE